MATFFTKSEARAAARTGTVAKSAGGTKTSAQILRESRVAARDAEIFDIFLSHSITDADLVLGVKSLLESRGLKVYVDWDTDSQVDRSAVSPETADLLRKRMKQSASLLYLATEAASGSKWMPWELGFFDGLRSGHVAIMPLVDNPNEKFVGQEYLGLYPKVTQDTYNGTTTKDVFVEDSKRWTTLDNFRRPDLVWKLYATK